jgi:ankyrin repeat protein
MLTFLAYKGDIMAQDFAGMTLLHLHLSAGCINFEFVQLAVSLMQKASSVLSPFTSKDKDGRIALHHAVKRHDDRTQRDVIEYLIEHGDGREARDKHGKTPLHLAIEARELNVAHTLIDKHHVKKSPKDNNGVTPLQHLLGDLVRCGADETTQAEIRKYPLHTVIEKGWLMVVVVLLDLDYNCEAKTKDNKTALHIAAGGTSLQLAQLDSIQDYDSRVSENASSHDMGSAMAKLAMIGFLHDFGANVEAKDTSKRTALHYAASHGNKTVAEELIQTLAASRAAVVSELGSECPALIYL